MRRENLACNREAHPGAIVARHARLEELSVLPGWRGHPAPLSEKLDLDEVAVLAERGDHAKWPAPTRRPASFRTSTLRSDAKVSGRISVRSSSPSGSWNLQLGVLLLKDGKKTVTNAHELDADVEAAPAASGRRPGRGDERELQRYEVEGGLQLRDAGDEGRLVEGALSESERRAKRGDRSRSPATPMFTLRPSSDAV